ncbi:MAG: ribosome maturation factor RimM [Humidesulfovibrio sp.]|nr:16S rRNA processing protein RimM [Desulfovibrio sp.]MDO9083917.1 ribosome maturation factor RimM [Humidesulfovibrio sp.]
MPGKPKPAAHGLVAVARIAKPHGIRGELCMDSHAGSPLLFAPGQTLFLAAPAHAGPGRPKAYAVAASRQHTGRVLVTLQGVGDRNAADLLRGAEVFVAEADLPPPDEGEEYLHKLLGCRVLLPDGAEVGLFEALLDTPGQLTWVIRAKGGQEILFPAVPQFILGLDAKKGEIVIDPPPGLLELYLAQPE